MWVLTNWLLKSGEQFLHSMHAYMPHHSTTAVHRSLTLSLVNRHDKEFNCASTSVAGLHCAGCRGCPDTPKNQLWGVGHPKKLKRNIRPTIQ